MEKYNSFERELVIRTVGIRYLGNVSMDGQVRPFGMSNEEFVHRKCNYHRATEKIFPLGRDQKGEHLLRKRLALSSLFEKSATRYVSDVLQRGRLCPNPESDAISNALVWAKQLEKIDPAALRELATMHFEKSGSTSKTRYRQDTSSNIQKNELESISHSMLADTIRGFADFIEQEK